MRAWISRVGRLLLARAGRHYPAAARRAGQQGTVVIALHIGAQGKLRAVRLHRSSGHRSLDAAALAAVRDVGRVPPPPVAQIKGPVLMPIAYRLR
ncbi:MAG: energy transducer TonB family protein [Polyangiales bacterium]